MSEGQRRRRHIVKVISAVVYPPLTVLAIGFGEQQPGTAFVLFLCSLPFAVLLYLALRSEALHG